MIESKLISLHYKNTTNIIKQSQNIYYMIKSKLSLSHYKLKILHILLNIWSILQKIVIRFIKDYKIFKIPK